MLTQDYNPNRRPLKIITNQETTNGEKVNKTIVVDRVPAFYLSNQKKFEAFRGENNQENSTYKELLFNIETEFDDKSILVFGLSSRYLKYLK